MHFIGREISIQRLQFIDRDWMFIAIHRQRAERKRVRECERYSFNVPQKNVFQAIKPVQVAKKVSENIIVPVSPKT